MFNSWSRSTLRLPGEPVLLLCECATAAMLGSSQSFLLVLTAEPVSILVLNTSLAEARLECTAAVADRAQHGGVSQACWHGDRIYLLRSSQTRIDVFEFLSSATQQHEEDAEEDGRYTLSALDPIPLDLPVQCIAMEQAENLVLGGANGDVLLLLLNKLGQGGKRTKLLRPNPFQQPSAGIAQIQSSPPFLGLISSHGEFVLSKQGRDSVLLECHSVACACFNEDNTLLALGLETIPRILLYSLLGDQGATTLLRTLVVFGPSLVEEELGLGGVRDLSFQHNNTTTALHQSVVAALFQGKSEPTMFHLGSGRRTTTGSGNRTAAALARGKQQQALVWPSRAPYSTFYLNQSSALCRQGLVQHAARASLVRNDFARFALLGEDHCATLCLDGTTPKFTRHDVPLEYCAKFGPLHALAIDDGGDRIAVASPRGGFCVFFGQARKWRRFQSAALEEEFRVQGMAWIPQSNLLLVVAKEAAAAAAGERRGTSCLLRIYNLSNQRLDAQPISSCELAAAPVAIEFAPQQSLALLLLPHGIQVFFYKTPAGGATLGAFFPKPSALRGDPTHLCLIPSSPKLLGSHLLLPRCVLVDSLGCCVSINLETGGDEVICLASAGVADVWHKLDPTLGVIIWTLVDAGLKLWIPALDPNGEIYQSEDADIAFAEIGSLPVGTEEDAFVCFQAHSHHVRASKSPALHGILGWLLRQKRDGLARRVLAERRFSPSSGLVRAALEDLLQGSLLGENKVKVDNAVNVLGCVPFEMMAAVVARCARQIDPELWEVLFSIVGQPRDLFQQCLVRFDANLAQGAVSSQNAELLLIAAELLPIVDADRDDPNEGPVRRAKQVLLRCEAGGRLEREVKEYAAKRGLILVDDNVPEITAAAAIAAEAEQEENGQEEYVPEPGVVSAFIASFFA